jgi:hypothetical protein
LLAANGKLTAFRHAALLVASFAKNNIMARRNAPMKRWKNILMEAKYELL